MGLEIPGTMSRWVNICDLGAIGDGVTDNTEVFRKAIDQYDVIYVPQGWYIVSDSLALKRNTTLIGLNPISTQLKLKESTPAFSGFGSPKALLETPQGGTNVVSGIGLNTGAYNYRAVGCKWMAGINSYMNDVKFLGVHALCRELEQRKDYLSGEKIETIYFGGGTPSQLSQDEFQQVFDTIGKYYDIASVEEVTLEANPDDLSLEYVHSLRQLPFNRISIGIQTFQDNTLKLLKRRHSGQEAIEAVKRCRENGFNNISIDLIYGLPGETEST